MLTPEVKQSIDQCVLCWLATVDSNSLPNVSPKEVFTYYGEQSLLIANIASPKSVLNIQQNEKVCVSLIDIFRQKGFKLVGRGKVIDKSKVNFSIPYSAACNSGQ